MAKRFFYVCAGILTRSRLGTLVAALTALTSLCAQPTLAAPPCDHVVSYFRYQYSGPEPTHNEWRILDPSSLKSAVFLSFPGGSNGRMFEGVRWDTTFRNVYFISRDTLYRAEWKLGARPHSVTTLPSDIQRWWFNPDSGCWQALRVIGYPSPEELDPGLYSGELWQSSRDGASWHQVRADTVWDNFGWRWLVGGALGREAPIVTMDDLASEAWDGAWVYRAVPLDTSTVTLAKEQTGYDTEDWLFLGLRASPNRGIAFRSGGSGAPEHDWSGVMGPFYFVDLDRHSKALIDGIEEGVMQSLAAERCGVVLIPGVEQSPLLLDSTGRRLFAPPDRSEGAVWVPRPRSK